MAQGTARFARQMCLPEIGLDGQFRIEAGAVRLGGHLDDLGRDVARRYARGAGISREREDSVGGMPEALGHFRHAHARSVAAGALAALSAVSEALAP